MSAAARQANPKRRTIRPGFLRRVLQTIMPDRSTLLVVTALAATLAAVTMLAWQRLRPVVVADRQYRLAPEHIHITPPPAWIHADIRAEALRNASLDHPLSILDPDLTARIAAAFAAQDRRPLRRPVTWGRGVVSGLFQGGKRRRLPQAKGKQ